MLGVGLSISKNFTENVASGGVAPSVVVNPTISRVGNSIVCNKGTWTGTAPITYGYTFIVSLDGGLNFTVVQSGVSDTYNLAIGDNLGIVRCNVTGDNGISPIGFAASNDISIGQLLPVNNVAPTISGNRFVSQTLSGTAGTWANASSYGYQWQRSTNGGANWSDISGATSATYVAAVADMANRIRRRVRATNSFGNTDAFSGNLQIVYTVLDGYSNVPIAIDLRLQRGAYYGSNLVEIWRTVDNALLNIGHDADGNLNIAAAIAHAGNVNRIIQSQTFSNAAWTKSNCSIIATNGLAPDATNTASTIRMTSAGGLIFQGQPVNLIPNTNVVNPTRQYCFSFHIKKINQAVFRLGNGITTATSFNLDTPSGNFVSLGNGWFRCWIVANGNQFDGPFLESSGLGDEFQIWGAQLNLGSTPTPYTPTVLDPSGFCKTRTNYDHSVNARHATATQYSRADFIVVDGEAIIEEGQVVQERYDSTHNGAGDYAHASYSAGANTTVYDKHRRFTNNYVPTSANMHYIHTGGGAGFNEPSLYNSSLALSNVYAVTIWNRARPNGQCFRRIISNSNWDTGTLRTNLVSTNPTWSGVRSNFFDTYGRYRLRATIVFLTQHDLATMQAISLLI